MKIIFVCIGNVCRSPTAEIILRDMLNKVSLSHVEVWSAGVDVTNGDPIDPVSLEVLAVNGYDGTAPGSRPFEWEWAETVDLILTMDLYTREILRIWITDYELRKKIRHFADYCPAVKGPEIFNPWGHKRSVYESVFETIEQGCSGIMEGIHNGHLG